MSDNNLDTSADVTRPKPRLAFAKYGEYSQVASKLCDSLLQSQKVRSGGANSPHIERTIVSPIPKLDRIVAASGQRERTVCSPKAFVPDCPDSTTITCISFAPAATAARATLSALLDCICSNWTGEPCCMPARETTAFAFSNAWVRVSLLVASAGTGGGRWPPSSVSFNLA